MSASERPALDDAAAYPGALITDGETCFFEIVDRRRRTVYEKRRKLVIVEVRLQDGAQPPDHPPGGWVPLAHLLDFEVLRPTFKKAVERMGSPA
jgi:hypothetical protein